MILQQAARAIKTPERQCPEHVVDVVAIKLFVQSGTKMLDQAAENKSQQAKRDEWHRRATADRNRKRNEKEQAQCLIAKGQHKVLPHPRPHSVVPGHETRPC